MKRRTQSNSNIVIVQKHTYNFQNYSLILLKGREQTRNQIELQELFNRNNVYRKAIKRSGKDICRKRSKDTILRDEYLKN